MLLWLFIIFAEVCLSQTFDTVDDSSPGLDALSFEAKNDLSVTGDSVLVDGSIDSNPPGLITYDRTLVSIMRIISNLDVTSRFGLRMIADSRYSIRKKFEEREPRNIREDEWFEAKPSMDVIYKSYGGVDFFIGSQVWFLAEHTKTSESVNFSAKDQYGQALLVIPRGGVILRTPTVSVGFSYAQNKEATVTVDKHASDGSHITTETVIYSPVTIGTFARFRLWGYPTDVEYDLVRAGQGGQKAQNGEFIKEDYARYRAGCFIPWSGKNLNFQLAAIHKTLSYSDNAYMDLETIPMTAIHFKIISGTVEKHFYVGAIYGQGADEQNFPEFNAKYKVTAYGGKAGINYRF